MVNTDFDLLTTKLDNARAEVHAPGCGPGLQIRKQLSFRWSVVNEVEPCSSNRRPFTSSRSVEGVMGSRLVSLLSQNHHEISRVEL